MGDISPRSKLESPTTSGGPAGVGSCSGVCSSSRPVVRYVISQTSASRLLSASGRASNGTSNRSPSRARKTRAGSPTRGSSGSITVALRVLPTPISESPITIAVRKLSTSASMSAPSPSNIA